MKTFADWLADELKKRGWTQSDFADVLKVPRQTVAGWIHARNFPTLDNMKAIARALGLEPMQILAAIGWFEFPSPLRSEALQRIAGELSPLEDDDIDAFVPLARAFAQAMLREREKPTEATSEEDE